MFINKKEYVNTKGGLIPERFHEILKPPDKESLASALFPFEPCPHESDLAPLFEPK